LDGGYLILQIKSQSLAKTPKGKSKTEIKYEPFCGSALLILSWWKLHGLGKLATLCNSKGFACEFALGEEGAFRGKIVKILITKMI